MAVRGRTRLWLACAATAALVLPLGWFWHASLLPDTYDMAAMGYADWGGGPASSHAWNPMSEDGDIASSMFPSGVRHPMTTWSG